MVATAAAAAAAAAAVAAAASVNLPLPPSLPRHADLFYQRKERRRHSLNRNFYGDYLGLEDKPGVRALVGKRERVEFAQTVARHEKKFKVSVGRTS